MEYSTVIKNINKVIIANILTISLLTACHADEEGNTTSKTAPMTESLQMADSGNLITGVVKESMDGGGYTYMSLAVDGETKWIAGPKTEVSVGSTVSIAPPMPMNNFKSTALNREFDTIYFTGKIIPAGSDMNAASSMPKNTMPEMAKSNQANPHAGMNMDKAVSVAVDSTTPNEHVSAAAKKSQPIAGIKKAKDGKTINDIMTQQSELAGKSVKIRGKVIKFTAEVMNKNWIHIKDSSTGGDLTITTDSTAKVGDMILVDGKIAIDKDFGYGYIYKVILEDAKVTIE